MVESNPVQDDFLNPHLVPSAEVRSLYIPDKVQSYPIKL